MHRDQHDAPLRLRLVTVLVILVGVLGLLATACGGEDGAEEGAPEAAETSPDAGDEATGKKLKVAWLLFGPENDGGWNLTHLAAEEPIKERFGSSVELVKTDNVPFTEEAGQITQRFIDEGANVVIDTVGLGEIFTDVCADNADVTCLQVVPPGQLPENTGGYWVEHWIPAYTTGVVAGLLTESNTVGYVSAFDIPLITSSINSFTLGCRSVNPECKTRVITVNDYFDPSATAKAANSLIDAGADVIRGYTDDPSYCPVAEQRGVFVIGEFWDASSQCPNWIATSTMWNFSDYYLSQLEAIQSGTWQQEDLVYIPAEGVFSLGEWGPNVPTEVREQTEQTFEDLKAGNVNPFVGPITDNTGKVRVEEGETLERDFLYSGWEWPVEGVTSSR